MYVLPGDTNSPAHWAKSFTLAFNPYWRKLAEDTSLFETALYGLKCSVYAAPKSQKVRRCQLGQSCFKAEGRRDKIIVGSTLGNTMQHLIISSE